MICPVSIILPLSSFSHESCGFAHMERVVHTRETLFIIFYFIFRVTAHVHQVSHAAFAINLSDFFHRPQSQYTNVLFINTVPICTATWLYAIWFAGEKCHSSSTLWAALYSLHDRPHFTRARSICALPCVSHYPSPWRLFLPLEDVERCMTVTCDPTHQPLHTTE